MINHKLISVIMGAYNCEATIRASIESILKQTYTNLELLVVDDGSDDRTYDICKSIRDKRLKIYKNNKNIGLTKSLNKLISYSNGEFIARQDADDLSFKKRIEEQVKEMNKHDLDFCTTRALVKNTRKKIPGVSYFVPSKIISKFKNPFIHLSLIHI